jgi:hypothetical protein
MAKLERQIEERQRALTLLRANLTLYAGPHRMKLDTAHSRCEEIERELAALAGRCGAIKLLFLGAAAGVGSERPTSPG